MTSGGWGCESLALLMRPAADIITLHYIKLTLQLKHLQSIKTRSEFVPLSSCSLNCSVGGESRRWPPVWGALGERMTFYLVNGMWSNSTVTVSVRKRAELLGGSTKIWKINKNCSHLTVKCRPADIFGEGSLAEGSAAMNHRAEW